ncbi:TetR/AcrR family transcriptional regulator [Streptomyces thermolilacinus]|uniref:Transcriptional regulator n=1 Tax=Streptomyces thermolilacinus SPC6 TaxID=1306406 RepID=A0A1D3DVU2_9ACTN|nr:TetR family transcriptional regulator [Streptomyces thermolilacinus]OEJ96433.1 transcriptional regulator [Streptomyces thermolilacinus SPC6]
MTVGQSAATGSAPGLRERKKQRTRTALLRTALELFTTKGYEETTVDEIADAVEVSQRTFFRYFPSKEAAAFALQQMTEQHFVEALRTRPAEEGPFDALRNSVLGTWDTIGEAITEIVPVDVHLRMLQVIESTPTLLAAHLRRSLDMEEYVARLIADREGLDVDADPRPRVAVACFGSVMRVTGQLWVRGDDPSLDGLRALTVAYLDHLAPTLATNWRETAAAPAGPHAAGTDSA